MAVTGFVWGMALLCIFGAALCIAGIILLVMLLKRRKRKGLIVLPVLLLVVGVLCAALPTGYFAMISRAENEREQSRGALLTAIEKDPSDAAAVQSLLDGGIDPDEGTESGYTPLMAASFRQGTQVMELLLRAGADVNRQDSSGRTALMAACSHPAGHLPDPEGIQLLLKNGADISLKDNNGRTAYDLLVLRADDDREALKRQPERLADYEAAVEALQPQAE